jgi:hypothetical protein
MEGRGGGGPRQAARADYTTLAATLFQPQGDERVSVAGRLAHQQQDRAATLRLQFADANLDIGGARDIAFTGLGDHVAGLDVLLRCQPIGIDLDHHRALGVGRNVESLPQFVADRRQGHAEQRALHLRVGIRLGGDHLALLQPADLDLDLLQPAVAHDLHHNDLADRRIGDDARQVAHLLDRPAIEAHHNVAWL